MRIRDEKLKEELRLRDNNQAAKNKEKIRELSSTHLANI